MLSAAQVVKLISANESLQVQLNELNEILAIREEELALLRSEAQQSTELQSRLDGHLTDISSMQEQLGKKDRQALGAEEREIALHVELTEAAKQHQAYNELATRFRYLQTRFNDLDYELSAYRSEHRELEAKAKQAAQLGSLLAMANVEIESLKAKTVI